MVIGLKDNMIIMVIRYIEKIMMVFNKHVNKYNLN